MLKVFDRRKKRKLQKDQVREEKRRLRRQEEEASRNRWAQIQEAVSGAPNGKARRNRPED